MLGNCPKCGLGPMRGPRYTRDHAGERLVYQCAVCGYRMERACSDKREEEYKLDARKDGGR
jgi:hypothetical protein